MIPVSSPIISKNAKKNLLECLSSGWVSSSGPFVKLFEEKFAKYLGVKFAVTTTSGTSALHLAIASLNIGKDDEVIIPTFTMAATAFAIVYTGATPVLVDSELETWNMDITQIEKKITKKTKAIIVVHIYGHPVNMDQIKKIATKHKLFIIEDAAEALGSEYKTKKVGNLSDLACFSFYANKAVTCGEGGMVVTNNSKIAIRLKRLKDMAYSPKKRFLHTEIGFTYRMSNLQAALGLAQLEQVDKMIQQKRSIANFYNTHLLPIKKLTLPPEKKWAKNSYWMYCILSNDRDKLRSELLKKGVDTRNFFIPMHRQPALKKIGLYRNEHYPVADLLSKTGLYLPSGPEISKEDLAYVCKTIKDIYEV